MAGEGREEGIEMLVPLALRLHITPHLTRPAAAATSFLDGSLTAGW